MSSTRNISQNTLISEGSRVVASVFDIHIAGQNSSNPSFTQLMVVLLVIHWLLQASHAAEYTKHITPIDYEVPHSGKFLII